MKLHKLLFVFLLITSGVALRAQTTGGPDLFGYHWTNNLDPIGSAPVYNWKDIKDTANLVDGMGDDNSVGPFEPGYYFNYYGQWYDKLWIGSNGWISFQNAGNITAPFPVIPTPSAPDNIIAGLLSDLTLKDANDSLVPGAAVYYWTNHIDTIIVQYDSVPFWDSSAAGYSGRNTFQIILAEPNYSITFQYKQLINSTPGYDLTNTGLKTGIEDSTGDDGLQVTDTFPADSSCVKFFYPGHFSTNDLENTAFLLGQNFPNPANDQTTINYTVKKAGMATLSIQTLIGTEVLASSIGNVNAGKQSFRINTSTLAPGIYFYTLSLNGTSSTGKMVIAR